MMQYPSVIWSMYCTTRATIMYTLVDAGAVGLASRSFQTNLRPAPNAVTTRPIKNVPIHAKANLTRVSRAHSLNKYTIQERLADPVNWNPVIHMVVGVRRVLQKLLVPCCEGGDGEGG